MLSRYTLAGCVVKCLVAHHPPRLLAVDGMPLDFLASADPRPPLVPLGAFSRTPLAVRVVPPPVGPAAPPPPRAPAPAGTDRAVQHGCHGSHLPVRDGAVQHDQRKRRRTHAVDVPAVAALVRHHCFPFRRGPSAPSRAPARNRTALTRHGGAAPYALVCLVPSARGSRRLTARHGLMSACLRGYPPRARSPGGRSANRRRGYHPPRFGIMRHTISRMRSTSSAVNRYKLSGSPASCASS